MRVRAALAALFTLVCSLAWGTARADAACRIAFDLGSSGIRVGADVSPASARFDHDYLGPLAAAERFLAVVAPTSVALRELPEQAKLPADCERLGGGFSAWRRAAEVDAAALVTTLREIRRNSGVAILVMPQEAEGRYGYIAAHTLLGAQLTTTHVLDIGGGSLQIAGPDGGTGAALGQKLWYRELCTRLGRNGDPCVLQPLQDGELETLRTITQELLLPLVTPLPPDTTLTAISRPVSRGVWPVLRRLGDASALETGIALAPLKLGIERLASLSLGETAKLTGARPPRVSYLLADMLLVEGLLRGTRNAFLPVADIEATNVPGLLADAHAYAWARRYDCYLDRLRQRGVAAYGEDPASCP